MNESILWWRILALLVLLGPGSPLARSQTAEAELAPALEGTAFPLARRVAELSPGAIEVANRVWSAAEVGYQETVSAAALTRYLEASGFSVEQGVADIPTAFVATAGSGEPVVGLLAEFDALPGLSQRAIPQRQPLTAGAAGHACGHHLFGAGSALAGRVLAEWLATRSAGTGTVKVFGSPAEEGGIR